MTVNSSAYFRGKKKTSPPAFPVTKQGKPPDIWATRKINLMNHRVRGFDRQTKKKKSD
jgi:hypothetical protein